MDGNYESAVVKLRELLTALDLTNPTLTAREGVLARYGPLFRPEGVQRITAEEFASFLRFENNQHWGGLHRMSGHLTSDMAALRRGLAVLVDEARDLLSRFNESLESLHGLGYGIASAVLLVAYPDRYAVWNGKSESALDRLGILPRFSRGATRGERYKKLNEIILKLRDDLGTDLWTVDLLFSQLIDARGDVIVIEPEIAEWFREHIGSREYAQAERDYKMGVQLLVSRLLSASSVDAPKFPSLLATFFQGKLEPEDVGLDGEDVAEIRRRFGSSGVDLIGAVTNLAGGKWGVPHLTWIPRAVEAGLGEELRAAFRALVAKTPSLSERVDGFREEMEQVQIHLRDKGGFESGWKVRKPSLHFVGLILGGYDRKQYTFYSPRNLARALEKLGARWPTGKRRYEEVCKLVRLTEKALREAGVPVKDMIDAQSFLYMIGRVNGPTPPPPDPDGEGRRLAEELLWPTDRAEELLDIARRGKPLLFSGPPGTGKTFVARALAQALTEDEARIEVVQFHPSYAYEDFMEGIRPRIGESGGVRYEIVPGALKALCQEAAADPEAQFILIIDEINRANLPRVLGEVLYCVEYRGKDEPIRLPYSGEEFWIPENLLIIGTMNTADRSIAIVDAALRRRFLEIRFDPDPELLRRWWTKEGNSSVGEIAARKLDALNQELRVILDAHRQVGHTYLMDRRIAQEGFEPVWNWQLRPVLAEHLYARPEEVDRLGEVFLKA